MTFAYNGIQYRWQRDATEGNWITRDNRFVHLALQCELSKAARASGLNEEHNFARHTPKPEKRKSVSVGGVKTSPTAIRIRVVI